MAFCAIIFHPSKWRVFPRRNVIEFARVDNFQNGLKCRQQTVRVQGLRPVALGQFGSNRLYQFETFRSV